jgi:hypothetical protein
VPPVEIGALKRLLAALPTESPAERGAAAGTGCNQVGDHIRGVVFAACHASRRKLPPITCLLDACRDGYRKNAAQLIMRKPRRAT